MAMHWPLGTVNKRNKYTLQLKHFNIIIVIYRMMFVLEGRYVLNITFTYTFLQTNSVSKKNKSVNNSKWSYVNK